MRKGAHVFHVGSPEHAEAVALSAKIFRFGPDECVPEFRNPAWDIVPLPSEASYFGKSAQGFWGSICATSRHFGDAWIALLITERSPCCESPISGVRICGVDDPLFVGNACFDLWEYFEGGVFQLVGSSGKWGYFDIDHWISVFGADPDAPPSPFDAWRLTSIDDLKVKTDDSLRAPLEKIFAKARRNA